MVSRQRRRGWWLSAQTQKLCCKGGEPDTTSLGGMGTEAGEGDVHLHEVHKTTKIGRG